MAGPPGGARRHVRRPPARGDSPCDLCSTSGKQDAHHRSRRLRCIRRWHRRHQVGPWPHALPPGPVREARKDGRRRSLRRSLSLCSGAGVEASPDLRRRPGSVSGDESGGREIPEGVGRAVVDPARFHGQRQATRTRAWPALLRRCFPTISTSLPNNTRNRTKRSSEKPASRPRISADTFG